VTGNCEEITNGLLKNWSHAIPGRLSEGNLRVCSKALRGKQHTYSPSRWYLPCFGRRTDQSHESSLDRKNTSATPDGVSRTGSLSLSWSLLYRDDPKSGELRRLGECNSHQGGAGETVPGNRSRKRCSRRRRYFPRALQGFNTNTVWSPAECFRITSSQAIDLRQQRAYWKNILNLRGFWCG
jgi:hypothetical protein